MRWVVTASAEEALKGAEIICCDIVAAIAEGAIAEADLVELGHLLTHPTPDTPSGITIFKSVGGGVEDWVVANLAVERYVATNGRRHEVRL